MAGSRVVVGVAGAASGQAAASGTLAWAVAEASATGRRLLICHACRPDSALAAHGAGAGMAMLELAEPSLARAVAAARLRLGGDRVEVVVRPQPPAELLVAVATPADLLVVGAPTRSGWLDRSSTTHHVVRHAPGPVVVVRPTRTAGASARRGAEAPVAAAHVEPRVEADASFDDTSADRGSDRGAGRSRGERP